MPHKLLLDQAKTNELCQELYCTMARQATETGKAVECERLRSIGEELQQHMLALGEGEHSTTLSTLFAPQSHLHGRCHDILIGNAHEGTEFAIIELGTHRMLLRGINLSNHHIVTFNTKYAHTALHRRHAVERGGSLNHIDLFIAAHTGNLAIVLHTNEQSTSIGVGKRR